MRIGLMQPTFLPWAGYLNMISICDRFIFLNDVQISPKSFQVRNRIPAANGKFKWIGVKESSNLPIPNRLLNSTYLSDPEGTFKGIENTLKGSYLDSVELDYLLSSLKQGLKPESSLAKLNISLIGTLLELLGKPFDYALSSEIGVNGHGSERVVELLREMNCTEYVVAPGSLEYMTGEEIWASSGFQLSVYNYFPIAYPQRHQVNFLSHMSSIDILFELGANQAKKNIFGSNFNLTPWVPN
jgi:hypothetical protein